jgi:hypothetical protein
MWINILDEFLTMTGDFKIIESDNESWISAVEIIQRCCIKKAKKIANNLVRPIQTGRKIFLHF